MVRTRTTFALSAVTALLVAAAPAAALASVDPDLDQVIDQSQPIVEGEAVLSTGHVDLGPRFVDGEWTLLIHDDAARADPATQSSWRHLDQTALHVVDAAQLAVPDDPAYSFLGVDVGEQVWVIPQTQHPDVVWLGWNTQDPDVMTAISRGITLSLVGVDGPGSMTVYLQSGTFDEPDVLWTSLEPTLQSAWVDVNTHTHANWVFSEPGVYLVQLTAEAELIDGSSVSDTTVLRIAVGDSTDPQLALDAEWSGPQGAPAVTDADAEAANADAGDPLVAVLIAAIVVVALGLVLAAVVIAVRGARVRRVALGGRRESADDVEHQ